MVTVGPGGISTGRVAVTGGGSGLILFLLRGGTCSSVFSVNKSA